MKLETGLQISTCPLHKKFLSVSFHILMDGKVHYWCRLMDSFLLKAEPFKYILHVSDSHWVTSSSLGGKGIVHDCRKYNGHLSSALTHQCQVYRTSLIEESNEKQNESKGNVVAMTACICDCLSVTCCTWPVCRRY